MSRSAATDRPAIDLDETGADEAAWFAVADALGPWRTPSPARRVVIVAPHPDDETLGVGGTIATLAAAGSPITVVCVTDGEAAPSPLTPDVLGPLRCGELQRAVRHLAPAADVVRLGLPDGGVAGATDLLAERLAEILGPDDLMLATLDGDGHPDHEAVGAAARLSALVRGAELWCYPVWAWHWHDPQRSPIARGRRVDLTPAARQAKADAVHEYVSQLDGPTPVVPAGHVRRCLRPFEVVVAA